MKKILCFVLFLFVFSTVFAHTKEYYLVDLGSLSDENTVFPSTIPLGINNSGIVVGTSVSLSDNQNHAFIWDKESGIMDLLGISCNARRITGSGLVLGKNSGDFIWDKDNGARGIGIFGELSFARDINDSGVITGLYFPEAGKSSRAFTWHKDTGIKDLGAIGDGTSSANGINNLGVVVGDVNFDPFGRGPAHGFIWDQNSGIRDIGTLGGEFSIAQDINDLNVVVGSSWKVSNGPACAFIWDEANGMRDIATLGQSSFSESINLSGVVVGSFTDDDLNSCAFIWDKDNGMRQLSALIDNSSGEKLLNAYGINDAGQIIGTYISEKYKFFNEGPGLYWEYEVRGFILNPLAVPEPGSMILFCLGAATLAVLKRKMILDCRFLR